VAVDITIQGTDLTSATDTEEQTASNAGGLVYADYPRTGQRLTISNRRVTKLSFWFGKQGSPTGDVAFTIRKVSDDSVIQSEVWGDAGDIPGTDWHEVVFSSPQTINEEVRILLEFTGGDSTNGVNMYFQSSDVKASEVWTRYTEGDGYGDASAYDCRYKYEYELAWGLAADATPGENTYGLKAGLEGGDYTIIVKKSETYNTLKTNLAPAATQKWGLKLWMPTSVTDYDAQEMSGTVTLVASATS